MRIAEPPAGISPAPQLVVAMAPIAVPAPAPAPAPQLEGYVPTDDVPQLTGSDEFFLARQPPAEMRALAESALPEFAAADLEIEPQHIATPAYGYSLATMAAAQPNVFTAESTPLPPPMPPAPPQAAPPAYTPPPAAASTGPTPALMFPSLATGNSRPAREGATPEPFQVPHSASVAPTAWPAPPPVVPSVAEQPQGFVSYASPPPFNPEEVAEADIMEPPAIPEAEAEPLEALPPIPVPPLPEEAPPPPPESWVQSAVANDPNAAPSFADVPVDPRETEPTRHDFAANEDDDFKLPRRPIWPFAVAVCVLIAGGYAVYARSHHETPPPEAPKPPVVASAQSAVPEAPTPAPVPAPAAPSEPVDNAAEPNVPSVAENHETPAAATPSPAAVPEPTPAEALAAAAANVPTPMLGPTVIPGAPVAPSAVAVTPPPPAAMDFGAASANAEPEPQLQTGANPNKNAQACYNRGNRLLNQNKVWLATQELNNCLVIDPSYGRVYRSLGVAYMLLGRERASIQAYEKFVDAEPHHKDVPKVREIIADYYRRRKN